MILDKEIEEVKKGCGEIYKLYPFKYERVVSTCGDNRLHEKEDPLNLCPECKAKLQAFKKAQEIVEKKIEALNKLNKENLYGYALSNANDNVNKIFGDKSTKGEKNVRKLNR